MSSRQSTVCEMDETNFEDIQRTLLNECNNFIIDADDKVDPGDKERPILEQIPGISTVSAIYSCWEEKIN